MEDRLKPRDWGNGIPKYKESDLMTDEEIHDFGIEIVANFLTKEGYKIHVYNPRLGSYPSIVAENEKEVIAVAVKTSIAPQMPEFKIIDKYGLIGYCNSYNTTPCFASVGIGSTDGERFEKSLALVGDSYYANFKGLEYISKDLPKVGTEEYKAFVMQFIGGYLRSENYEAIKEYISDECIINNEIDKTETKKNAFQYLVNNFKEQPVISHCVIISVGNYKLINVAKLHIEGYSDGEPGTVKILQKPDEIGLLLVTKNPLFENDDPGIVFNVEFDNKGKINKIEIVDPRFYEFKPLEG